MERKKCAREEGRSEREIDGERGERAGERARSYTRAKHGKAISVQPRFLVSTRRESSRGSRGIYMRVYMCAPSVKKDELS